MAKTFYKFQEYICPVCGNNLDVRTTESSDLLLSLYCVSEKCKNYGRTCAFALSDGKPMIYDKNGKIIGKLKDKNGNVIEGNFSGKGK